MGEIYSFKCFSCGYQIQSSGKEDRGMVAVTRSYICSSCNNITDVLVGEYGIVYNPSEVKSKKDFYSCAECSSKEIIPWDIKTKPCPKCGSCMSEDPEGDVILWD